MLLEPLTTPRVHNYLSVSSSMWLDKVGVDVVTVVPG